MQRLAPLPASQFHEFFETDLSEIRVVGAERWRAATPHVSLFSIFNGHLVSLYPKPPPPPLTYNASFNVVVGDGDDIAETVTICNCNM